MRTHIIITTGLTDRHISTGDFTYHGCPICRLCDKWFKELGDVPEFPLFEGGWTVAELTPLSAGY
jgi:hypothetical protein